jgi:hypothetical protein
MTLSGTATEYVLHGATSYNRLPRRPAPGEDIRERLFGGGAQTS